MSGLFKQSCTYLCKLPHVTPPNDETQSISSLLHSTLVDPTPKSCSVSYLKRVDNSFKNIGTILPGSLKGCVPA